MTAITGKLVYKPFPMKKKGYAIIDEVTTRCMPSCQRITKIAISLHHSREITKEFSTLIYPGMNIPVAFARLTG